MIKKSLFSVLFAFSILFASCNMQDVSDTGTSLKIALPRNAEKVATKYEASDIVQYEVVITNEYNKSFVKTGRPGETISFDHVLTGNYDIDVFALDESGYTGARGSVSASVKENETCNVAITASLLYRSDFFISGADGVWLSNHSDYFINSTFKNYRNDVDFSVTTENSTSEAEAPAIELIPVTSVRLTNGNIPYIYVNALDTKNSTIFGSDQVTSVSFEAKSSVPSTVNFYFQDIDHEPIGVVLQAELTNEFKKYEMFIPARMSLERSLWSGTLRAGVTSGNGTVTIKNPFVTNNASGNTAAYTCYPPDTKGVKTYLTEDRGSYYHTFEFTDTSAYGGLVGHVFYNSTNQEVNNSYVLNVKSSEENVIITFYLYTLGGGIQELGSGQIVEGDNSEFCTFPFEPDPLPAVTASDYEFTAVLFKVNKPTIITID